MICRCITICLLSLSILVTGRVSPVKAKTDTDFISALKDTLQALSSRSDEELFRIHCQSVVAIIEDNLNYTHADSAYLAEIYECLLNISADASPRNFSSFLERKRTLIIAWTSPTDGVVSFTRLRLPANWDPEMEYPLYVDLHGLWDVAATTLSYLNYPFTAAPSSSFAFEDGYHIMPWGRGNIWYRGISETDIWECIGKINELFLINPYRQYLFGHSMGGSGAWYLAHRSPHLWAAIASHAGALWYDQSNEVNASVAQQLKDVPAYFVVGTSDRNLNVNQEACWLLQEAGNPYTEFVTFEGGHVYIQENVENMYQWMKEFENTDYTDINITMENNLALTDRLWNYPNPVNNSTLIHYSLSRSGYVELGIYSQNGRQVQTLFEGERNAGRHMLEWSPGELPTGLYYCRMKSGPRMVTIKILIVQ